jgi:TonB family protein
MKRILLVMGLFIAVLSSFAQTNNSLTSYFDGEWKDCDSSEAMYYRKAIWGPDKKLAVRDYYKAENTIQMTGFFKDKSGQIKTDSFVYFYKSGAVKSCGRFEQNKGEGEWIHFFENQNKESEGKFRNGKREGKWIFYHENGVIGSVEIYEADSLQKMRCWDEKGVPQSVCYEEQIAEFPGGQSAMMEFLGENLQYPGMLREMGITGRVVVSFNVDQEGNLSNFIIIKSVDEEFSKEVLRILPLMPKWTPTISHGRVLQTRFTLPIVFRLN